MRITWNVERSGTYYLRISHHDPHAYGQGNDYTVKASLDHEPPGRVKGVRLTPLDGSIAVEWDVPSDPDIVGYYVDHGTQSGSYNGYKEVDGRDTDFYRITDLSNGTRYYVVVSAFDFAGNVGARSREVSAMPQPGGDGTRPTIRITGPTDADRYETSATKLAIWGEVTDEGENLSRVHLYNQATGDAGWDYGPSGGSSSFQFFDVPLAPGDNRIVVTGYDSADNSAQDELVLHRSAGEVGAAIIVAGVREDREAQNHIYYSTDHAYRVFQRAGMRAEEIYYLSPEPRDADRDQENDVDGFSTPEELHWALKEWAVGRVGPGRPLWMYLMDHGDREYFCMDGCDKPGGQLRASQLAAWLDELEAATGLDEVNVIYEACHSGSFIDLPESVSGLGRVVISSASREGVAWSVQGGGAQFSDPFLTRLGGGGSLWESFQAGQRNAHGQTPWLDGDGDGMPNEPVDQEVADRRHLLMSPLGIGLEIRQVRLTEVGENAATIQAEVRWGSAAGERVWAAIYPPSWEPDPGDGVAMPEDGSEPLALLDEDGDGVYVGRYTAFDEPGQYRIVIHAADRDGDQAEPREVWFGEVRMYLPVVRNAE
ncbi:MAG TPA: hypothetical protein EYH31_10660 [Anaerolineae bacterium]|nr:hypothetical protein [Anaerolineae bacterium]